MSTPSPDPSSRIYRLAAGALFLALCIAGLSVAKSLLAPIVIAVLLRILLAPLTRYFAARGVPYALSSTVLVVGLLATLGLGIYTLSGPASDMVADGRRHAHAVKKKLASFHSSFSEVEAAINSLDPMEKKGKKEVVATKETYSALRTAFSWTYLLAIYILAVSVLLFFLLARGDALAKKLPEMVTRKNRREWLKMYERIEDRVSEYLITISIINSAFGMSVGVGLWLLDFPNPALWGTIAGLLNFIPYLGAIVGSVGLFLISASLHDSSLAIVLPALVYLGLNGLEAYVITPLILGRTLALSPVAVVLSLMFWGWVWGVLGIIIAVPLLIVLKVASSYSDGWNRLAVLLRA